VLVVAVAVLMAWRLAPVKVMLGGAIVGIVRNRLCDLPALRATVCIGSWVR
jgi:hypothetical protein